MKFKILIASGVVLIALFFSGCYKDVYYPDFDPNQPISFSGDLIPIFTQNCSTSGCHDDVPTHKPALTPEKAYDAIVGGGYINRIDPESSQIYQEVKSGAMPPSGALKSADVQRILLWIKGGALNN